MALKITLKPHERMVIGGAVVTNGNSTASANLIIENNVPVLREKEIVSVKDANTHCKKIYFVIQLMYIDEDNLVTHHNTYWKLIHDLINAAPSTLGLVDQISEHIVNGRYYQALKIAKELITYERRLLNREHEFVGSIQNN